MRNLFLSFVFVSVTGFLQAQTISTFPYFVGFEGLQGTLNYNYPAGWTYEDLNAGMSNQSWQIIKNSSTGQNSRTDSTAIHMFSSMSETNNDWLYTPGIEMKEGGVYTLTFWYNTRRFGSSIEKCKVHVGSSASATDMVATPLWDENNLINESYQMATIEYTATADGVQYFGFNYYSEALSFILYIDDITITELVTGIDNLKNVSHSLSPNPCSDKLQIKGLSDGSYKVELFDLMGRKVFSNEFIGSSKVLNIQELQPGNYVINVWNGNNELIIRDQVSVVAN